MKPLLFIVLLLNFGLIATEINERKIDVYFADGVDTEIDDARDNAYLIDAELAHYIPEVYKKHLLDTNGNDFQGKVAYSYNQTNGMALDFVESTLVKLGLQGFMDYFFPTDHQYDLDIQVETYKERIKLGH